MNIRQFGKRLFLGGILAAFGAAGVQAALTEKFYANSSVLSSGTWVKIGVEETGVYEIPYSTLREMGFSDPSKVSLYGRGGRVLSESFVTNAGVPILTDDLAPVKVIHEDGCLYFYGLGPDEITYESSSTYSTGGYFKRKSRNIYSNRGYYFLTDSKDVDAMNTVSYNATNAKAVTKGISYVYHEVDSAQNSTNSGQLFWGEHIGGPYYDRRSWDISMPDAIEGKGVMECELYIKHNDAIGTKATVGYGIEEGSIQLLTPYKADEALYYSPHQPTMAEIGIPAGGKGKAYVEFKGHQEMPEYSNLDFWVISYERALPTMKDPDGRSLAQQLLALPDIARSTTGRVELDNSASLVVLDVSTPATPQRLKITQQGDKGIVGVYNSSKTPVIVVFDKDKPQLHISGFEKAYDMITNQNLHALKQEGAEYIIITTPAFRDYAEELADLHREYDGMKVAVVTTEECYNEFSGGTPDPMAYRSFARMLTYSPVQPKIMLLFGPLYADFRGLNSEHNPTEGIIAYQSPSISVSRGAHNINDFYGMMSDKFRTDYYERNEVQIGVAILPVKFGHEARTVIDKVHAYLERDDHAYYLNRYIAIGGIEDEQTEHIHESQVREIDLHIRKMDNTGTMFTPIPVDTYGKAESRKKFMNGLNEGCGMFSYFGHGAEMFLGKDRHLFSAGDVNSLRNKVLPLALFGGCELTNSDRGYRGLGETIVTNTPYGAIGSIVSARETWSGQNFEFFKQFFNCLFTTGGNVTSEHRDDPVTIGEVYGALKHYSTYSNELAYQLLCDPAIVIPTINRSLSVKAVKPEGAATELIPGETFKMTGDVIYSDGRKDTGFNGQVVLRFAEPSREVAAGCLESGKCKENGKEGPDLKFTFRDQQIGMAVADVKNGHFDMEVHIPSSVSSFKGEKTLFYFASYDPSTRVGGAVCLTVPVGETPQVTTESSDVIPPVVEEFSFSQTQQAISFTVSDNVALNHSNNPLEKGLYLYIDGKERSEAHFTEPVLETGRAAFSKTVLLDGITYGEHTARLKVKDVAGNVTETEIVFTNNPLKALYTITRSETSRPDCTVVEIEGDAPASAELVVLSAEGNEVWRGQFKGNSVEWNHESAGAKVPAGHYKGYLIETGTGSMKGHSETIDLPVI